MSTSTTSAKSIFLQAVELPTAGERHAYLDAQCGADADLRREVDDLLQYHGEVGSFLESPPTAVAESAEQLRTNLPQSPSLGFLQPSSREDSLGRLGRHEILEVVGSGGMGVVLKAFDEQLQRVVAIKALADSLASNEHARRRFVREGRAAAAIRDDHVIGIYGVDETNGLPFLVMEYIVGRSLAQRIEAEGPLPLAEILRIGAQIARGLAAAHSQGVVHRDIKPANILLENGVERVKITDFGLAHAVDDVRTTQPGTVIGTPEYMSPEQARGEKVDHRSDLFSLGCVLYAMCAGRPPFRAESTVAIIRRVCDDTPRPLTEINPEIPEWLVGLIDKLIAKDASERFQSAAEVAELLGQYLAHVQQPAVNPQPTVITKPRPLRRQTSANARRGWSIAAAVVLLLGAGLSLAESTGVTNLSATVIRIVRGDGTLVVEIDDPNIQVLLDGEELVITGAGPKELRLRPGQHELQSVKDGKAVETKLVTITRDGREVVKVAREQAGPAGPSTRLVWADGGNQTEAISPDGKYLSYVDPTNGDVAVRELATGKNRRLSNQGWPAYSRSSVFSPDSKQIAYSWINKDRVNELRLVGLDGSEPRVLYPNKEKEVVFLVACDWSADGKYILASFIAKQPARQIVLVSVVDGSVRVLKSDLSAGAGRMRLSPDGRYVAYSAPQGMTFRPHDIFLLATDGSGEVPLVEHSADDFVLGWAPDGKRLVFASDRSDSMGIWLIPVAEGKRQGAPELVKSDMGRFDELGLTRRGSFYYRLHSGGQNVYTATLDLEKGVLVTPPVEAIQRSDGFNWAPAWSADGRYLACLSGRSNRLHSVSRLYIRSIEGNEVRRLPPDLTGADLRFLHWSADGQSLLYAGSGGFGVKRVDVQTGDVTHIGTGLCLYPNMAPDGTALFYLKPSPPADRLIRRDLQTNVEQELYHTLGRRLHSLTLSPDGRQLAFTEGGALKVLLATGGAPRDLVTGKGYISTIAWMPDGQDLIFQRLIPPAPRLEPTKEMWRVPATGGDAQKLDLALPSLEHLRIHPDGRQIAFTAHGPQPDKSEVWALENFLPPLADSKLPTAADASAATSK